MAAPRQQLHRRPRAGARRVGGATFALAAAWPAAALALDRSKTPEGTNHAAAHVGPHMSTGADIRVGVIEIGGGVDPAKTRLDEDGRLSKNLDFRNTAPQVGAEPPAVGARVNNHATLVADVIGSSHATQTGVAPGARIYSAAVNTDNSIFAAVEYYSRAETVGIFNLSLGGPALAISDTENHSNPGVPAILDAAGDTTNIAAAPFDFTGQTIPAQLDRLSIRLFVSDGDSGIGEIPPGGGPPPPDDFDADNLELTLDGVNLPLKLNGLRNSAPAQVWGGTFTFDLTPTQSAALLGQLGDNQMVAQIRRVADRPDTDSMNNSGNRLTPSNAAGADGDAELAFFQFNDNSNSRLVYQLDRLATVRDALIVVSAGNEGEGSAQVTDPGDLLNGITVGATDTSLVARAHFSSYRLSGDTGTNTDRGHKPEILAPGSGVLSQTLQNSGTSFAAPHVAGIAALIQKGTEQNTGLPLGTVIDNHLAVKAILLNSARKRFINGPVNAERTALDFPGTASEASDDDYLLADGSLRAGGVAPKTDSWTPSLWSVSDPNDGGSFPLFTTSRPLDDEQGVGLADAERALVQLDAGEQAPGSVDGLGWDRGVLGIPRSASYTFDELIAEGTFITATLVWDRVITVTEQGGGADDGIFETTDVYADGEFIDFDLVLLFQGELIARSFSADGTLEHLHFPAPAAGEVNDYELRVDLAIGSGASYGLAWWTVPEPSTAVLMLVGCGLLSGRVRRGATVPGSYPRAAEVS